MPKRIDLTGKTFGRLYVEECAGTEASSANLLWRCLCSCGNRIVVVSKSLRSGNTKSCGCLRKEVLSVARKHGAWLGGKPTAEYRAWRCMLNRCYRKKDRSYQWYGKLGVRVHLPWQKSFEKFLKYVGLKPSAKHSLDRYPDPAGDYQPGNIRWATARQQRLNRRVQTK